MKLYCDQEICDNVTIEKVSEEDALGLMDIYSYYVENTAVSFEYTTPTVEEFKKRIRTISEKYPYIKAVDENKNIFGYAYAGPFKGRAAYDWAVETTIYVKKDCHKKGLGKMLYNALEESLKGMGILNMNACIAFTDMPDQYLSNASMLFHKALGYELAGRFHNCGYKFNKWYDMIWMEKIIGEHIETQPQVRFGGWTI